PGSPVIGVGSYMVRLTTHTAERRSRQAHYTTRPAGLQPPSSRQFRAGRQVHDWASASGARRMFSSRSCASSTGEGASVRRQDALAVLGKAITSRRELAPHINITRRSKPGAIPPWGGAPYWRASRRKRKRRWASSGPIPKRL